MQALAASIFVPKSLIAPHAFGSEGAREAVARVICSVVCIAAGKLAFSTSASAAALCSLASGALADDTIEWASRAVCNIALVSQGKAQLQNTELLSELQSRPCSKSRPLSAPCFSSGCHVSSGALSASLKATCLHTAQTILLPPLRSAVTKYLLSVPPCVQFLRF